MAGTVTPQFAKMRIAEIMRAKIRWNPVAVVMAYVLSGGEFAVFFRGGNMEVFVAMCVGLAVGLLAVAIQRTGAHLDDSHPFP